MASERGGADRRKPPPNASRGRGSREQPSDGDRRSGGARGSRDRGSPDPGGRTDRVDQATYDGPPIPETVTGKELDRSVAGQLKTLPDKLALRVAKHLVAAGMLIDEDPETAYQHTLAARARAARLGVVREACGEAAYAAGHYQAALSELRAARRMNGSAIYLPIMADCHRALGQPEQALKLARTEAVESLDTESRAEMVLVESGARRDLGQLDAALRVFEQAPLDTRSRAAWAIRLRYAYADTLLEAGRTTDALAWFHRTAAIDPESITDAADRAAVLEQAQEDADRDASD